MPNNGEDVRDEGAHRKPWRIGMENVTVALAASFRSY
jgi:hypothetical protein